MSVNGKFQLLGVAKGIELAYLCLGPPDSTKAPLFVPALSWLGADLVDLAHDRRVVFFDVRGRGRSSRVDRIEDLSLEFDLDDLGALQAHLSQLDESFAQVDLLGWSYYGALSAQYALRAGERVNRVVLVGPSPARSKPWFGRFLDNFARRVDLGELHQLERDKRAGLRERDPMAYGRRVSAVFHRAYVNDPRVIDDMRSDPCVDPNADVDRVNDQSRRVIEKLGDYDWRDAMGSLRAPVLIVHGSEDPIPSAGSEEWCHALPQAELKLLKGVGHMPWLEAPRAFRECLADFL